MALFTAVGIISNPVSPPVIAPEPPQSLVWIEEVEAKELSIPAQIEQIGQLWGSTTTEIALAIAEAESNFDPLAKNPDSSASGLFQLTKATIEDNCPDINPFNSLDNIKCSLKMLGDGQYWRWGSSMYGENGWLNKLSTTMRAEIKKNCECVSFFNSKRKIKILKNAEDIEPNSPPVVGGGVLLSYSNYEHIAYIEKITAKGMYVSESNLKKCALTSRWIMWNDKAIRGFVK